jgi:hypothetical protein
VFISVHLWLNLFLRSKGQMFLIPKSEISGPRITPIMRMEQKVEAGEVNGKEGNH